MIRGLSLNVTTRSLNLRFLAESVFALSLGSIADPEAQETGRWFLQRTWTRKAGETNTALVKRVNTVLSFLPGTRLGFRPELLIEDGIITIRCHIVGVKFGLVTGEEP